MRTLLKNRNFKEKMNFLRAVGTIFLIIVLVGCQSPKSAKQPKEEPQNKATADLNGNFSISGAFALYPLISRLAGEFMTLHPGVKIIVEKTGTGEGITALLEKKCQLAMISRPLTEEELKAGIITIPIAKDGVAPIVNQKNPYLDKIVSQGISPDEFLKVFVSGLTMTWGDILGIKASEKINVYIRADESGAADLFAGFLYKKSADLKGIGVTGDEEMIEKIQNDIMSIGFCNFSYAFEIGTGERRKGIQVIPCDLDFDNKIDRVEMPFANLEEAHRSLWLGFYPDDLCRELTLGFAGKPEDPAVIEFLYFVLGDGQNSIKTVGLCPLNNIYIRDAIQKLE